MIDAICQLRRETGFGPHRIAYTLGRPVSTVYGVLRRQGLSVLQHMERTTRTVVRYERDRPGELIHVDVKKLGRIPDRGGKHFDAGFLETGSGRKRPGRGRRGHDYIHVAVDDHIRYAYAEVGIRVERVLTDNRVSYRRSSHFKAMAARYDIGQRFTRPYRTHANGEAEAVSKTMQREWAQ